MGITIRGVAGRLSYGSRAVASFTEWELTDLPGQRRGRLHARFVTLDPVYWGRLADLQVHLDMGGDEVMRGVARVEAEDPLQLIVEEIDDG